ncbi:MAG TPA: hypothetical protein PLD64_03805 [Flavobacterium sp.]|jgi:chromosome segregation ATPase|uniref:hypothetical protein n=1 Tax=Flavobacterium sp. TaxID=239 RepID=UPI001B74654A|nr:hypothetical protein [Flavobacterium sp.]MBP7183052.1 hypothetical protein [Flavobacterium sp.]HRM45528.1 hypothetical protein [Flavobacterium sp.]
MKKMIFTLAITTFIASTVLVGCQGSTKKEEAAKDKIEEARDELDDAKEELSEARVAATEAEWKTFKESTNATIAQNEIRITELKAKMKKTGKTIDDEYAKRIKELEEKNKEIKLKVESYKNDANSDWKSFKEEYNHDMDELGQALKNFTVDKK